ncbi:MAG: type II secretion system F family protein [Thermoguttaceae bacterium]|jgi:general secretion pathway protein F/type IV pilus assembly protein PilC
MTDFQYIARDNTGQKISGMIQAAGRREATAALVARSLFPVEIGESVKSIEPKKVRRVPGQLLSTTFAQMADLLHSGVPLLRSLEVIQKQTTHAGLNHILEEIHHQVEEGATLADAMNRFPRIFNDMSISMIRAGGEGGFLEEALSRVAQFTEAQEDMKKRTLGAVAYPAFLCVVGVTVVTVLIVFFVPQFGDLFARLRERNELPAATDWLLWLSDMLRTHGWWMLPALIAGGWFSRHWLLTQKGGMWLDRLKLKLPLVGPILQSLAVARFCRILGTMLRNGVPILRSLEISRNATGNRVLGEAIAEATENISAGQSLAEPLRASGRFPPTVVEMIAVAEQANNLENVLLDVADSLEKTTWRKLDLAVRLIEPILLLILAAAVLLVVVALLLPMFKMSQAI